MIDPSNKYFSHRLYRNDCTLVDGVYVKDLRSLGRPLESTVIVDNSVYVFGYHHSNGIPIASFFGQPWDEELKPLVSQPKILAFCWLYLFFFLRSNQFV